MRVIAASATLRKAPSLDEQTTRQAESISACARKALKLPPPKIRQSASNTRERSTLSPKPRPALPSAAGFFAGQGPCDPAAASFGQAWRWPFQHLLLGPWRAKHINPSKNLRCQRLFGSMDSASAAQRGQTTGANVFSSAQAVLHIRRPLGTAYLNLQSMRSKTPLCHGRGIPRHLQRPKAVFSNRKHEQHVHRHAWPCKSRKVHLKSLSWMPAVRAGVTEKSSQWQRLGCSQPHAPQRRH